MRRRKLMAQINVVPFIDVILVLLIVFMIATPALRTGEISAVAPFRYSVVLFAIGTGYVIWGEVPDSWTMIGVMIVAAAGLYTFHRERRVLARARSGEVEPGSP